LSPGLSKLEDEGLLYREKPAFLDWSSPFVALFGDRLDLSSRLFPGLLNTIIFALRYL
jgi:hypothetical protein